MLAFQIPKYAQKYLDIFPEPEPKLLSISEADRTRYNIKNKVISVSIPNIDIDDTLAVFNQMKTGWISSISKVVKDFEEKFAEYIGVKYAISCSSGTAALHLSLTGIGVKEGDSVIHPDFTMIAVPNCVSYLGGRSILIDSHKDDFNMDLDKISHLNEKTIRNMSIKAIIITHTYGQVCDINAVLTLCRKFKIKFIEDAAEALGLEYNGKKCGALSDVAGFSLYSNKTITSGEGGMVVTNDFELAKIIRTLMNHGFSSDRHFWHKYRGYNYRMTAMQAVLGLSQLKKIDKILNKKKIVTKDYNFKLKKYKDLVLPKTKSSGDTCWMYGVQAKDGRSKEFLRKYLADKGIETRNFFVPISLQPYYHERYKEYADKNINAIKLMEVGFYLPTYPDLTVNEISYIADKIGEALNKLE